MTDIIIEQPQTIVMPFKKGQMLPHDIRTEKHEDGNEYCFAIFDGHAVCGSKKRKSIYLCEKPPMQGRNRCRNHGGKSPRGIAHPSFKTGEWSKDLPSRIAPRYEQARNDPKLLELRETIAIVEARTADVLSRVDTGESGIMWKQIKTSYNAMRSAVQAGDQQEFLRLLNDMGRLINRANSDYEAWDEVKSMMTMRRRLVESENKRLVQTKQMMTAEQAMAMLSYVVSVIRKHVKDETQRANISMEINDYLSRSGGK